MDVWGCVTCGGVNEHSASCVFYSPPKPEPREETLPCGLLPDDPLPRKQGPWGSEPQPRISDECPSCGSRSIFIGSGGWLTCAILGCKSPGVATTIKATRKRAEAAEAERDALRHSLREILTTPGVWVGMSGRPHAEGCRCVLCVGLALLAPVTTPEAQ